MKMTPVLGEIVGWEVLVILGLVVFLFGGSQIPKLARSIGRASKEFRSGLEDEPSDRDDKKKS